MKRLTDEELLGLLDDTESDRAERKQSFKGDTPSKGRQAICAFANDLPNYNEPGILFVGARDDGTPSHEPITDRLLQRYENNGKQPSRTATREAEAARSPRSAASEGRTDRTDREATPASKKNTIEKRRIKTRHHHRPHTDGDEANRGREEKRGTEGPKRRRDRTTPTAGAGETQTGGDNRTGKNATARRRKGSAREATQGKTATTEAPRGHQRNARDDQPPRGRDATRHRTTTTKRGGSGRRKGETERKKGRGHERTERGTKRTRGGRRPKKKKSSRPTRALFCVR